MGCACNGFRGLGAVYHPADPTSPTTAGPPPPTKNCPPPTTLLKDGVCQLPTGPVDPCPGGVQDLVTKKCISAEQLDLATRCTKQLEAKTITDTACRDLCEKYPKDNILCDAIAMAKDACEGKFPAPNASAKKEACDIVNGVYGSPSGDKTKTYLIVGGIALAALGIWYFSSKGGR